MLTKHRLSIELGITLESTIRDEMNSELVNRIERQVRGIVEDWQREGRFDRSGEVKTHLIRVSERKVGKI